MNQQDAIDRRTTPSLPASGPSPALTDEPEIVKFVRVDAAHYPGEYAPEVYDPRLAKEVFDEIIDEAVEAEALGWDGFFFTEHHFDAWSLIPSPNVLLAALALKTKRMRLGTGVYILPAYDPVRLAEEVGMLDVLSGGRLEVGLGRGNFQFELDRFTAPVEESVARFDENLDVFTRAIRSNHLIYNGQWTHVRKPATVYPRPIQDPLPVWVGATSPATVQKVGRLGFNLAGGGYPDGGERLARFVEASHKAGRTVDGANFIVLAPVFVAPTDSDAERIADEVAKLTLPFIEKRTESPPPSGTIPPGEALIKFAVFGSPVTVADKLAHILKGCGARRLMAVIRFRGTSTEIVRQTQHLFATEVAPRLRELKT
jgi:alkanesulfonate monooxygenase SsuD/methylene tetrahydromethanopterin reductase-like flavin-dependent oxidoreductase (luciferase family)